MNNWKKFWIFFFFGLAVLALVLLASSLSKLDFQPGTLFDRDTTHEITRLFGQFGAYRGVWLVCVAIIPIFFFVFTLMKQSRYQPLRTARRNSTIVVLVQLILFAVAFILIRRRLMDHPVNFMTPKGSQPPAILNFTEVDKLPVNISEWLAFIAGFIILFGICLWIGWVVWKHRKPLYSLDRLAEKALNALEDLEGGGDLRNVILLCYFEMTQAVELHRGVKRSQGMTPREFEIRLVNLGIPVEPVQQLTRLFEDVRYGAKELGSKSERQARSCLTAIASACKGEG